jgi:hypothetical protein
MKNRSVRTLAKLAVLLTLPITATAQAPQQAATLAIAGQTERAALVQINGKSYVDVESLARIMHGSIRFQGSQTILTLPGSASTTAQPVPPNNSPQLSGDFLRVEIEELTAIREWRVAIVTAVQTNNPVTENWVGGLRRSADSKLQLATAAATTEPDRNAVALLRNEFTNMQQMSDQFLAIHSKLSYTAPDSFDNNPLDQKIMNCSRGLASMAATKQFQDEASCH